MAIFALVIHELSHVLAVNYLGGRVEKVGLFPLGLSAKFTGLEKLLAWERYVIYGAGSLANAIAAAWMLTVSRLSYLGIPWLEQLAFYNIVLCIFNLTPVLPLDGGRIVHQFLCNRIGIRPAGRIMLKLGLCVSTVLIFLGFVQVTLYYNITLLCAGVYIKKQNKKMKHVLEMEFFRFLEAKNNPARGRLMPVKTIQIPENMKIKHAMDRLTIDHFTEFVLKSGGKGEHPFFKCQETASHFPVHVLRHGVSRVHEKKRQSRFLVQTDMLQKSCVPAIGMELKKECTLSEKALLIHIFEFGLQGTAGEIIISLPSP